MSGPIADALGVVRRARVRLIFAQVATGACRGAAVGALAGLVLLAVAALAGVAASEWIAVVPVAGLAAGAGWALAVRPDLERAALLLDSAARTDEAFVSSLTATGAREDFRELAAAYALERCPPASVRRVLPLEPPRTAPLAAVAAALLAALLLVPGDGAAAPARATGDLPGQLVPSHEPARDGPSAAAGTSDLRELAQALAEDGSEPARRAVEALERGDRDAALDALREALTTPSPGSSRASTDGGSAAAAPESRDAAPAPWSASTWPLRYDRLVRRWSRLRTEGDPRPLGERR